MRTLYTTFSQFYFLNFKAALILLFLNFTIILNGQERDDLFIKELSQVEYKFDSKQNQRLESLRSNASFQDIKVITVGNLGDFDKKGFLPLVIPGTNTSVIVNRTTVNVFSDSKYQWNGVMSDDSGDVFINSSEDGVYGRIRYNGDIYMLEGLGGNIAALIKIDNSKYTPNECGVDGLNFKQDGVKATEEKRLKHHCDDLPVRIGVMFTQRAANTGLNLTNIAQTAINDLNSISGNSGLSSHDIAFRLAGTPIRLNGFNEVANDICGDADRFALNAVARAFRNRDDIEADLMILLTDGNYGGGAIGCVDEIGPRINDAYAVVEADLANGNFSFGHEVIHLMGGRHQQCDIFQNPGCDNLNGFNHGYGYKTGVWPFRKEKTTMMHQLRNGWTRQREVSNPDIHGVVNQNDNARMIEDNACTVAEFRETPFVVAITGPNSLRQNQIGRWCANVSGCTIQSRRWEVTTNGWNYTFVGSANCFTRRMTTPYLGIRLRITCTDGTTVTLFHHVFRSNFRSLKSNEAESLEVFTSNDIPISEINTIKLYPNPTIDALNVVYLNNGLDDTEIYLTDITGDVSKVYSQMNKYSGIVEIKLDLSTYVSGTYYLTLLNGEHLETKKFILQNDYSK